MLKGRDRKKRLYLNGCVNWFIIAGNLDSKRWKTFNYSMSRPVPDSVIIIYSLKALQLRMRKLFVVLFQSFLYLKTHIHIYIHFSQILISIFPLVLIKIFRSIIGYLIGILWLKGWVVNEHVDPFVHLSMRKQCCGDSDIFNVGISYSFLCAISIDYMIISAEFVWTN